MKGHKLRFVLKKAGMTRSGYFDHGNGDLPLALPYARKEGGGWKNNRAKQRLIHLLPKRLFLTKPRSKAKAFLKKRLTLKLVELKKA